MNPKHLAGSNTLEETERAIRFEEAAFRKCTGGEMAPPDNAFTFEDVSMPEGRLKLQLASSKAPSGHAKAWESTLLVSGAARQVVAWRAGTETHSAGRLKRAAGASEATSLPQLQPRAQPSRFAVAGKQLLGPDGKPVRQLASPNHSVGNSRKFLVLHYTGGTTLEGTVAWFMNPAARASAHLVVARDGSVVQMVGLDRRAWHAGESAWKNTKSLNAHSVGIEVVNAGKLRRTARGWVSWAERVIPDDEVTLATHRLDGEPAGWHEYTAEQIDTVLELAVALHAAYDFSDVLGHDDIAPQRKRDPGPLFPMEAIRARLFGRA